MTTTATTATARARARWTGIAAALGRNDLRGVFREPLLIMVFTSPLLYVLMVALPVPPLTTHLAETYGFDLVPYYPLILSSLPVLGTMLLLGCVGGLLMLEEKDTGMLHALRVTPLPLSGFAAYRCATLIAVATGYVVLACLFTGMVPLSLVPALLAIGVLTGVLAVFIALTMAALANNKVEGLALIRAVGFATAVLPLLPFFIDPPWEFAFGLVPSYWPSKAFWVAFDGGNYWPYLLVGLAYNALLVWGLGRLFIRRTQ